MKHKHCELLWTILICGYVIYGVNALYDMIYNHGYEAGASHERARAEIPFSGSSINGNTIWITR